MSTTIKQFAEDTTEPLRLQIGTGDAPQSLSGATVSIVLKNKRTGARITSGTTTIDTPADAGQVRRAWQEGELVVGTTYLVEAIVNGRAYPGASEAALEVEIIARRTS